MLDGVVVSALRVPFQIVAEVVHLDLILEGASALGFAVEVWQRKFAHYEQKFEPEGF